MGRVIINNFEKLMVFFLFLVFFLSFQTNLSSFLSLTSNRSQVTAYQGNQTRDSSEGQQAAIYNGNKKADFNEAIAFTLKHEQGLVNDKADKGGITNYGISYTFLHNLLVHQPKYLSLFSLKKITQFGPSIIKKLTINQAIKIYYLEWWEKYHYEAIKNQAIATKAFDYSVNMGSKPAIKLLQTACQTLSKSSNVTVNGQLDTATLTFINNLNTSQITQLLYAYENVACNYYSHIAKQHPADKKFLLGWLKRANDNNYLVG